MPTALPRAWKELRREQTRQRKAATRIRRRASEPLAAEPTVSAEVAGLRYVNDLRTPGIRRIGTTKRFRYVDANGRTVSDTAVLGRIKSLVIPPAWRDVWIC